MPRTKLIDDAPVLALYAETANGLAVSRQLGIHSSTVYQIIRRHQNVCLRCQSPNVVQGHKQCAACEEFDRARVRERRAEKRRLGICADCDLPRGPVSRVYCETHRMAHAEIVLRSDAKRRGAVGGVPVIRRKLGYIRLKYGQAGADCFAEAEGRCEICGVHWSEASIHIHHIDENQANAARSNYACICWRCHRTIHLLIDARNRMGVIAWFEKTYPDRSIR